MLMLRVACLSLSLILCACGAAPSDPGPGGVTAGDAEALDKAAQKLDERDAVNEGNTEK